MIDKKQGVRSGGRPASFERSAAVRTALGMFRERGYEGVSIADLTAAIGVAPPSLYHAFGSKAGLMEEAIAFYEDSEAGLDLTKLSTSKTPRDWARGLLEAGAESVTKSGKACLISNGMIMCHPDNQAVAGTLAKRRTAFRQAISEQLLRWMPEPDAHRLARYLVTVLQGLSVQARDGATMDDLRPVIELTLSAAGLCGTQDGSAIGR
ncbi:TetR/AcrR family transcriptional regulator [Porphyrobacter sp. ULC335]|uniref:TetR/AcrR family transcriptional regulator n=1 Tax=Porphyrobacter sp. ULC335 TaxID=2854260 RepID=UPI00221FEC81|nr:TetR/AcrR family transcriptional regulator [Porphyrobacter sp. ULC335]UYV16689.1 TetR/AcrR family transcriptional regulator [Porphyrobacter sp. ULC335]